MEVVNIGAVSDHKAVRHASLQCRHVLAVHGECDRETGSDRAGDGLRRSGCATAGRCERCRNDGAEKQSFHCATSVSDCPLKWTVAEPQPTPWIQTFWTPEMSGAMSFWETIICAVKDSSLPSPAR